MDSSSGIKDLLKLTADELKAKIAAAGHEGTAEYDLYAALVIRKFMEKYHIKDVDTAFDEFMLFKKAQSDLVGLDEAERKSLTDVLVKVKG